MQNHASGDVATPFSCFTDSAKLSALLKEGTRPASTTTVSNLIALPVNQNKRELKTYLREKLFQANHDIRSILYKTLAKRIECNESMFGEQLYDQFAKDNFSQHQDIPLPQFAENDDLPEFYLNAEGKQTLKKILACIGYHFPQITCSPLLPIAVSLFLHYDDNPGQVFTHTCRLVFANSKFNYYLDINKPEVDASVFVLKDLCQKHTSSSHKSLLSLTSEPIMVYNEWIRCLFNALPFTYIVILFDMYLLEGYKSLYRVSLAILKYYRKHGVASESDLLNTVFDFVENIEEKASIPMLFRKAFSFKLPPSKEIKKHHRRILSTLNHQPAIITKETKHHRNPWDYLSVVRELKSEIVNETLLSTLYCSIPENVALNKPKVIFSTDMNGYNLQTLFTRVEDFEPTILLIKTINDEILGAYLSSPWSDRRDSTGFFGTGETFLFSLLPEAEIYKWVQLDQDKTNQDPHHNKGSNFLPPVKPPAGNSKGGKGVTLPPIHYDATVSPNTPSAKPVNQESVTLPPLVGTACVTPTKLNPKTVTTKSPEKNDMFMMADETGLVIGGGNGCGIFIDNSLLNGMSQTCTTFNNRPLVSSGGFTCAAVEVLGFDSA